MSCLYSAFTKAIMVLIDSWDAGEALVREGD